MKPTLAIYGSKDLDSRSYPVFTHAHNLGVMQDGKILQYLDTTTALICSSRNLSKIK